MPDLKEWIKAQLKKGYSVKSIKSVLVKRGYPPEAVAEADRITSSSLGSQRNHSKKLIPNKFILITLIVVALFVVWLLAMPFFSRQPAGNILPEQKSNEQDDAQHASICNKFSKIEGEISCEEAVAIATANYAGMVQNVDQGSNYRLRNETDQNGKDIWIVQVKLENPADKPYAHVFLDRKTGEELRRV